MIVLDASATGPIILNDEASDLLPGLDDALSAGGAYVPVHWHLEVANAIRIALVRGRLDETGATHAVRLVDSLLIEVDSHTRQRLFNATWRLAELHRLTIYDAAYLELAMRTGAQLASNDGSLLEAARRESVGLFGR